MTIIQPHKHQNTIYFLVAIFGVLLIGGLLYISLYNGLVDARHELSALQKSMVELETQNADLKNELFRMIDPGHLESYAVAAGLVMERHPAYLRHNQWLSDSSR